MEATIIQSFDYSEDKELEVILTGKLSYERKEWSLDDLTWNKEDFTKEENNFIDKSINYDQLFDKLIAKVKEEILENQEP